MGEKPALKVGGIVLISADNALRGKWLMGLVNRLFPGEDGSLVNQGIPGKPGKSGKTISCIQINQMECQRLC